MRSQHNRRIVSLTLALLCGVGFSGCQRTQFPSNPFAGKLPSLPMPNLLGGKLQAPLAQPMASKLPIPKLPSLPRPNFGNLARTIRTPAAEAIATRSNQPPVAPARTFDTSSADQQLAAAKMPSDVKASLESARKAAEESRDALDTSRNDFNSAVAGTKAPKSENLFSKVKTKPSQSTASTAKQVGSSSRSKNFWGDYKPDVGPSSSNRTSGGIEDLAKVNPRLYDRYGKLTSSNKNTDGQFVAINKERDFDFQPPKASRSTTDKVSSDNSNATIAGLRSQLMELRSRGAGTSEQLKIPHRSAFDIAGLAPVKPVVKEPELPIHRGFGDAASFGDRQQTVSIPDPTAPTNVLRPAALTPGLVATHEIKSSSTKPASDTLATDLPVGSKLSNKVVGQSDSTIDNDFVGSPGTELSNKSRQEEIPMLRAAAVEQVPSMELPRELSQASLDALELAKQEKQNQPLPEINKSSGPLLGGFQNPKVASTELQPQKSQPAQTFQQPSTAFPGRFQSQVPARQQQVTSNQFFNRAAKPAAVNAENAPSARVAEAQLLPPALPEGLTSGDSTYSPGSVRSLEKKLW